MHSSRTTARSYGQGQIELFLEQIPPVNGLEDDPYTISKSPATPNIYYHIETDSRLQHKCNQFSHDFISVCTSDKKLRNGPQTRHPGTTITDPILRITERSARIGSSWGLCGYIPAICLALHASGPLLFGKELASCLSFLFYRVFEGSRSCGLLPLH
ncbi:hypothetical protein K440DRAFT_645400 [Wilcoxina mikolae CBS 423.85]|nr:hypothetical protein K440DRAFT_645400 [Wilcoxina mikolae CBS 423.85]